ncbi:hypothetical protein [Halovenus sp. HT40]|uniref:hypothetical protein n=1 Tax=Halovenus sp. HT40 TaxID=3126691 RepID=UPI00300EECE0
MDENTDTTADKQAQTPDDLSAAILEQTGVNRLSELAFAEDERGVLYASTTEENVAERTVVKVDIVQQSAEEVDYESAEEKSLTRVPDAISGATHD